jgi:hypothetical protein
MSDQYSDVSAEVFMKRSAMNFALNIGERCNQDNALIERGADVLSAIRKFRPSTVTASP